MPGSSEPVHESATPVTPAGRELLAELAESPLPGARYAHHVVSLRLPLIEAQAAAAQASQVAALRGALEAHRECNRTSPFDLSLLSSTPDFATHDEQVRAEERERLHCPKCLSTDFYTRWHAETYGGDKSPRCGYSDMDAEGKQGEHLHRYCRNCGFQWRDALLAPVQPEETR